MNIILLSGGSGQRLWPLSNHTRAKQFLKFLKHHDQDESMVQRIWRQLKANRLESSTYITTSSSQVDIIRNRLGYDVPIIVEPERKDTFPAIALAATYLNGIANKPNNDIVCVIPVDSYVMDDYFLTIKNLESILLHSNANLALIGGRPTYPSAKYGYILPEKETISGFSSTYYKVKSFIEKPSEEDAKKLITHENALWNCGVFAFKIEFILKALKENHLPTNYNDLLKEYSNLPKISFDYQIVEKTKNLIVLPYDGPWKDLGTWNTFTEEIKSPCLGNAILSNECTNTHIINDLDIPVVSLGMSNTVIACSYDGILVTKKAESSKLKKYVENISKRPMYEERKWGWYKVLDYHEYDHNKVLTKKLAIHAGNNISYQYHNHRSEIWTVISGEGLFVLNDKIYPVKPNDVLKIPKGSKHSIKAITNLEIIEVQMGTELIEEDIVRLFTLWEEIENFINNETKSCDE